MAQAEREDKPCSHTLSIDICSWAFSGCIAVALVGHPHTGLSQTPGASGPSVAAMLWADREWAQARRFSPLPETAVGKALMGSFRTPGLRELASTAPYGHNGVLYTLEEWLKALCLCHVVASRYYVRDARSSSGACRDHPTGETGTDRFPPVPVLCVCVCVDAEASGSTRDARTMRQITTAPLAPLFGTPRHRVVLSRISMVCVVSVWLFWGGLGQAEDAAVTVEIVSTPSLEHLRPPMDLARVTLIALLHGKALSQGHMRVQLTAPPRTTALATDFPRVEGTSLLVFDSDLIGGVVSLQYRFPLRGTYTFDLEIIPVPGGPVFPPTSLRKTIRIPENSVMMRQSWLLVGLFVLGVISGGLVARFAAARAKLRSRAIIGSLVLCCGALAPISMVAAHGGHPEHESHGAPERQVIWGDDGWELEIHSIPMPVTVGHLLHLALWLRKDDEVFPGMMEVSIVAVNLEEAQTVVETHILARQGSTSQRLQLYESVPHSIAVTVRPVGGEARRLVIADGRDERRRDGWQPATRAADQDDGYLGWRAGGRDGRWLLRAPHVLSVGWASLRSACSVVSHLPVECKLQ